LEDAPTKRKHDAHQSELEEEDEVEEEAKQGDISSAKVQLNKNVFPSTW